MVLGEWADAVAKCKKAEKHGLAGEQQTEEDNDGRLRRVQSSRKAVEVPEEAADPTDDEDFSSDDSDHREKREKLRKRKHGKFIRTCMSL